MLLKKVHACLLILFSFFSLIESIKRRYDLVLHNITCEKFNSAVKEFDCDLQMLNAGSYALDMSFMYSKDLPKTAEWHTLIYFTHAQVKAGKPVKFLDFKINICNFLTTAMGVPFVKVLVEEMRKTSNLPYKCPLKGNFLYTLSNFSINSAKFLPAYAPLIKFNFTFNTYENQNHISKIFVMGSTTLRL